MHQLTVSGFTVDLRSDVHQKFIFIDEQNVGYRSVSLLAYGRKPEVMLRFVNKEIASETVYNAEKEPANENPTKAEKGI